MECAVQAAVVCVSKRMSWIKAARRGWQKNSLQRSRDSRVGVESGAAMVAVGDAGASSLP